MISGSGSLEAPCAHKRPDRSCIWTKPRKQAEPGINDLRQTDLDWDGVLTRSQSISEIARVFLTPCEQKARQPQFRVVYFNQEGVVLPRGAFRTAFSLARERRTMVVLDSRRPLRFRSISILIDADGRRLRPVLIIPLPGLIDFG